MTENQHPITPPPELVEQWAQMPAKNDIVLGNWVYIATQAARWGADQELEACCEWLVADHWGTLSRALRSARREPPSLKEQALMLLDDCSDRIDAAHENIIRRALESLPE